ncbi:hypothetical protein [Microbulbifer spongiae]|uniref:Prepilin type IV endopeptidase peptidase domain-containing protein n=1 Tax=Microbulbifer spongiae TaxID=2944933 RepID=A0ABY9E9C4_9GAMM|nr:hypothetical protein [Microbulbifer sp. MI-G]WKD49598.1 hypothetical protein M8T91_17175 [Microbulbifer sp. MI-G]
MVPVNAALTVFALVFAAIAWLRLLRIGFADGNLSGLLALFLPPLALLLLLPRWREETDLFLLAGASCGSLLLGQWLQ